MHRYRLWGKNRCRLILSRFDDRGIHHDLILFGVDVESLDQMDGSIEDPGTRDRHALRY